MSADSSSAILSGAAHLVDALKSAGVKTIFSLSGNQIMPVYDALIGSDIRLIHTRHEGAAVYMAEAHAQLTSEVGIALLTAGPGFANGLSAMYSARESQTPMVVLTGDAPLKLAGMGAFQEMDQQTPARSLAKGSFKVEEAAEMSAAVGNAISLALSGPSGPVHISLPDDVLRETANALPTAVSVPVPGEREIMAPKTTTTLATTIALAKRPLMIAGPAFCRPAYKGWIQDFAESTGVPSLALESPRGLRAPRLGAFAPVLAEADLIILAGKAPDFMLGFAAPNAIAADCKFIVLAQDEAEMAAARAALGERICQAEITDTAPYIKGLDMAATCIQALVRDMEPAWPDRVEEAIAWRPPEWQEIPADEPPFHAASVAHEVKKFVGANPELSLTIDGGEVGQWCQAILDCQYSIINGPSGAIGGSIPYAIAAKAARPDQPSIAMLGDGTAGFYFMEFETALRENLPFVAIVGNDAKWNAEHQIQVRDYGENRTHSCEMHPTRYDELAKAMGCYGENITNIADLVPAIERALASGKPACINVEIQSIAAPTITRG